ncbi:hypothetical protein OB919_19235 [Halobacteria archaeon AArc-curdl1]|uniref:Uncharacterized protein n=1 Tax=Natronosalvus hydrolyticus TaxID=2979988 RepID=A0AAP2ZBG2_9EURY|nr:hypothetical protein [Halobacteria archaeon AArc-curdl1]
MARQPPTTRRTALGTLATLVTGLGFAGATGATRDDTESPDAKASGHAPSTTSDQLAIDIEDHLPATPYETYIGTVDRIVDGRHVVILLEEGRQTVDQLVVDRERLPNVAERDHLLVLVNEGEFVAAWPLPDTVVRTIRDHRSFRDRY